MSGEVESLLVLLKSSAIQKEQYEQEMGLEVVLEKQKKITSCLDKLLLSMLRKQYLGDKS